MFALHPKANGSELGQNREKKNISQMSEFQGHNQHLRLRPTLCPRSLLQMEKSGDRQFCPGKDSGPDINEYTQNLEGPSKKKCPRRRNITLDNF